MLIVFSLTGQFLAVAMQLSPISTDIIESGAFSPLNCVSWIIQLYDCIAS
jgi:hypothetical protein